MSIADPQNARRVRAAALAFARRGWRVLPLSSATACAYSDTSGRRPRKVKLTLVDNETGVLTKSWQKQATTNQECVQQWWERCPGANVGVATGTESGLVGLIVNYDHPMVREFVAQLPHTVTSGVGDATRCYFFVMPADASMGNSTGSVPAGIHVRGDGCYVPMPPSVTGSGAPYEWVNAPDNTPLAHLPDWVQERIQGWPEVAPADGGARRDAARAKWLMAAAEWAKRCESAHTAAFNLSGMLRDDGLDMVSEAAPIMREFVALVSPTGTSKLTEEQALFKLKMAYRRPPPKAKARGSAKRPKSPAA
jgi:bifunctional DNA primase/polymerase-like protein